MDLPYFQLVDFQKFDRGEQVTQVFPANWSIHDIQPGDILEYDAGSNISGRARVVSSSLADNDELTCILEKVS